MSLHGPHLSSWGGVWGVWGGGRGWGSSQCHLRPHALQLLEDGVWAAMGLQGRGSTGACWRSWPWCLCLCWHAHTSGTQVQGRALQEALHACRYRSWGVKARRSWDSGMQCRVMTGMLYVHVQAQPSAHAPSQSDWLPISRYRVPRLHSLHSHQPSMQPLPARAASHDVGRPPTPQHCTWRQHRSCGG